ncbi:hypothetical protein MMC25_001041 [Agyrium rufum]|nr:hypothetical protein [Agyrium rufum]
MSETCIVCLGSLGESADNPINLVKSKPDPEPNPGEGEGIANGSTLGSSLPTHPSLPLFSPNHELIAHLLPCGHNLHDECLKPWVERANSCPICRQNFNLVELRKELHGSMITSYPVSDRTQVADVDPGMIIEDLEEESKPCPICGEDDNEEVLLLCDGCDMGYHTYCIGLDSVPLGAWFCETCSVQRAIEPVLPGGSRQQAMNSSRRRTRGQQRRQRVRNQATDSNWARVWQSVWDRLNLDLDFPFENAPSAIQYRRNTRSEGEHRRELRAWERRLRVAERQGGVNRFREVAPALLDRDPPVSRPRHEVPEPESREEIMAWNAMEKAKAIQDDPSPRRLKRKSATNSPSDQPSSSTRKRKRRSATTSPSEQFIENQPERRLKRPQTRRTPVVTDYESGESSSSRPRLSLRARRGQSPDSTLHQPSFLQSLLREVESNAPEDRVHNSRSPLTLNSVMPSDHSSLQNPSPAASPISSNHPSPRALSATPPPSLSPRPGSPILPLTSKIEPVYAPLHYHSDDTNGVDNVTNSLPTRASRPVERSRLSSPFRSDDQSPTRKLLPLSTKSMIQSMVKEALKAPYQDKLITKDEYTDINRTVSRLLYDRVGHLDNLNDDSRPNWEKLAKDEVDKALRVFTDMDYPNNGL